MIFDYMASSSAGSSSIIRRSLLSSVNRLLPLFLVANVFSLVYVCLVHFGDANQEKRETQTERLRELSSLDKSLEDRFPPNIASDANLKLNFEANQNVLEGKDPGTRARQTDHEMAAGVGVGSELSVCHDLSCLRMPLQSSTPTIKKTEGEMVSELQKQIPNIPFEYLYRQSQTKSGDDCSETSCNCLPDPSDLKINNDVWQEFSTQGIVMYLYAAYLDIRPANPTPCVRIISALSKPALPRNDTYPFCQLWYEEFKKPFVVEANDFMYLGWEGYFDPNDTTIMNTPYMFSCPLPKAVLMYNLIAVTLVNNPCDTASNALKVIHNRDSLKEQKEGVAICVKGLEFPYDDLTVRLMEWIEVMKQLNAAKISMYYLKLHPNIYKAMRYYEDRGFVELTHFPLSGNQPNSWLHQHFYLHSRFTSHIRHEKLAQHDCFYRHMYEYKYVAVIDPDEVILPLLDEDWPGLLRRTEYLTKRLQVTDTPSGFLFKHTYVFDDLFPYESSDIMDIPEDLHILRHIFRTNITIGKQAKTISRTDQVVKMTSHRPDLCFTGVCNNVWVKDTVGRLNHYRNGCVSNITEEFCLAMKQTWIEDKKLLRHKESIMDRIFVALKHIGIYG